MYLSILDHRRQDAEFKTGINREWNGAPRRRCLLPHFCGFGGVSNTQLCSLSTWKIHAQHPPIRKPGQAPHRAAGTFPGVTTTYEPGYEKPSASPRESYWTC